MKKLIAMILTLAMVFALCACGQSSTPAAAPAGDAAASDAADKPTYHFQIGYNTVEDSVRGEMAKAFKEYIESASDGRMTIDIFPAATLGDEQQMVEMVKLESLDFTLPGVTALSNVNSNFGSYSLPFLSDNYDQAHALLDGEYGDVLKGLAIDSGYKIVGWGDLGSVQITNNVRPINSLADMKGINMRCPNEEVSLATFQALGCVTTTLAFSELYLGLSQGVVDGQYNPIDAIYQNSFTEVQDYLAVVNIYIYGIAMIMNNSKFDSMSAEDQQIILDGAAKAQEVSREYCATADADYMQKVIDENCFKEITYPDTAEFKEAVASVYDNYLPSCDPRIVEAINASRGQ